MESPDESSTSKSSTTKDDGGGSVHLMGVDEEGIEVIVGVKWENLY